MNRFAEIQFGFMQFAQQFLMWTLTHAKFNQNSFITCENEIEQTYLIL